VSQHQAANLEAVWKQQIGAARLAWGMLTEDELLQSEGHTQKLAVLLKANYVLSHAEAVRQVGMFFDGRPAAQ
jgi:uncharacterized protein YjbJ (UPF0337 family)